MQELDPMNKRRSNDRGSGRSNGSSGQNGERAAKSAPSPASPGQRAPGKKSAAIVVFQAQS